MLVFPNCKINLGLQVVNKRADGFHNIETVFYPVNWCDALEVLENPGHEPFLYSQGGLEIKGTTEDNLIYKAWTLLKELKPLPNIRVHLHKNIPMGAGLGGGSSDAAFFINAVNLCFDLKMTPEERKSIASHLGSDCAFFIENKPVLGSGKGDEFSPVKLSLEEFYILVVYPAIHSNTREAYQGLTVKAPLNSLKEVIEGHITGWRKELKNDFESTLFARYPEISMVKEQLYSLGAVYSSMSGSGSAVFGIFKTEPGYKVPPGYSSFLSKPASIIL